MSEKAEEVVLLSGDFGTPSRTTLRFLSAFGVAKLGSGGVSFEHISAYVCTCTVLEGVMGDSVFLQNKVNGDSGTCLGVHLLEGSGVASAV
mmetsp:Transcript_1991/g.12666  ORF Transcript_1991/g.12666 Transcript_1991/m.12666 type:complete len:91 (+) Transcript_1991:4395-4667(+)